MTLHHKARYAQAWEVNFENANPDQLPIKFPGPESSDVDTSIQPETDKETNDDTTSTPAFSDVTRDVGDP